MHAATANLPELTFRKYDLSQSSRPAPAKVGFSLDNAEPESRLWKLRVASKTGLTIETALLGMLGLVATGAGACCLEQMLGFVTSDAMTHTVSALLR